MWVHGSLVRQGIISIIRQYHPEWKFIEAGNGFDAFRKAQQHQPDLILMDYQMPKMNGLDSSRLILDHFPEIRIIMVYGDLTDEQIMDAHAAGIMGFVPKILYQKELMAAINLVMDGKTYINGTIFDLARMQPVKSRWVKGSAEGLFSPRETEVLQLMMKGKTSKGIAEELNISKRTVDRHRSNLLSRIGARSHIELLRFALSVNCV